MSTKKYLTEENYQQGKKKLKAIIAVILTVGLLAGGSLIGIGLMKSAEVNAEFSDEGKAARLKTLQAQLDVEEEKLEALQLQLEDEVEVYEDKIKQLERKKTQNFTGFTDEWYALEDQIDDLKKEKEPLDEQLDEIEDYFNHYHTANPTVAEKAYELYYEINELENTDMGFKRRFNSSRYIPFFMFGGFIIVASLMFSLVLFTPLKRREILAFSAQQVMPVAKEGIEEMAPTIGRAGKAIAEEMAPVYGDIAKEIAAGIKEGLDDEEK